MKWGWKNWLMLGVVVAIFIAAGVILTVAITTEEDPRLFQVCWSDAGEVQYVGGGFGDEGMPEEMWICDAPSDLRWPDDHITVRVVDGDEGQTYSGDESDAHVVIEAIELLNDQLDTRLELTNEEDADIVFTFRAAYELGDDTDVNAIGRANDVGGWCVHNRTSGRLRAVGAIRPAGNIRTEYRRAVHELGHCLGLPHWRVGLMRQGDLDDSHDERMEFDRIADPQRSLIREVYP